MGEAFIVKRTLEPNTGSTVLFDGSDNTTLTGGWTATGNNVSDSSLTFSDGKMTFKNVSNGVSENGQWFVGPKNKINLSDYNTLKVTIDSITATSNIYIGVASVQTYAGIINGSTFKQFTGAGTHELDISEVDGPYYIGFGLYQNTINNHTVVFSNWELV